MALKIPAANTKNEIKSEIKSNNKIQDKIAKTVRIDADLVENLNNMAIENRYNFTTAMNVALNEYFSSKKN